MDARMDMEAQYGEEIRDNRTIRQKVGCTLHSCCVYILAALCYCFVERGREQG